MNRDFTSCSTTDDYVNVNVSPGVLHMESATSDGQLLGTWLKECQTFKKKSHLSPSIEGKGRKMCRRKL